MTVQDAFSNGFDDDPALGGLWQKGRKSFGKAGETTGEKQAREAREKALEKVKNADELAKQTRIENNANALRTKQDIEGEASDAEIQQVLQMMRNGYTPEQITAATGIGGGDGGGAQAYTPGTPQQPPITSAVSTPTAITQNGGRLPVQTRPNGIATRTKNAQPYQDASGNWVYPSSGERPIDGAASGAFLGGVDTFDSTARYGTLKERALAATTDRLSPDGRPVADNAAVDNNPQGTYEGFSPEEIAAASALANKGKWSQQGEYDKANATERDALSTLQAALGGIKNPELGDKFVDMTNHAVLGQQAKDAQGFAMDKLKGLTGIQETAEEKLMREVARRNQENQLSSARKATMQNLAARGVSGSGAELASMLGAQSSTAQSRAIEEMAAQANAQKRALAALDSYKDAGFKLGEQDRQFGAQANQTDSFNKQMKQQDNQWRVSAQRDLNNDTAKRAATSSDAQRDYARTIERQGNNRVNTKLTETGLLNGTATEGAKFENDTGYRAADAFKDEANRKEANDPGRGGFLGFL